MMPYIWVTSVCNKAPHFPHPWEAWRRVCGPSVSGTEAGACRERGFGVMQAEVWVSSLP